MTDSTPSQVVRHLGLIKVMAIIMAVLIIIAFSVIVATIYSRLNAVNVTKSIQQSELLVPADSWVTDASFGHKGEMLLVIENKAGQQLWQVGPAGKIQRKIRIAQRP